MYQKSDDKGFTLIEVMVAVTILAVSLIVIINLFSKSLMASNDIRHYTMGLILAQSKMTQIKIGLETESSGIFEKGDVEYEWKTQIDETEIKGIEEIQLKVSWKGKKKQKSIDLIGYRIWGSRE